LSGPELGNLSDSRSVQSFKFEETSSMVDILDDGGYVEDWKLSKMSLTERYREIL
jgi:hypothetical protein